MDTTEIVDFTEDHGLTPDELQSLVETLLTEDWASLSQAAAIDHLRSLIDAAHDTDREDAISAVLRLVTKVWTLGTYRKWRTKSSICATPCRPA